MDEHLLIGVAGLGGAFALAGTIIWCIGKLV